MNKKSLKIYITIVLLFLIGFGVNYLRKNFDFNNDFEVGQKIDSLNGVYVYYNGKTGNSVGRNRTEDGYNLGLKYQCVEFVKRYYYQNYQHKMPDSYGNAKDFFDSSLKDGEINKKRDLLQFTNPSFSKPEIGDLLIYAPTVSNEFGHVAIVANVEKNKIEIIQQNPGPYGKLREKFSLSKKDNQWQIENNRIYGWLRKEQDSLPK